MSEYQQQQHKSRNLSSPLRFANDTQDSLISLSMDSPPHNKNQISKQQLAGDMKKEQNLSFKQPHVQPQLASERVIQKQPVKQGYKTLSELLEAHSAMQKKKEQQQYEYGTDAFNLKQQIISMIDPSLQTNRRKLMRNQLKYIYHSSVSGGRKTTYWGGEGGRREGHPSFSTFHEADDQLKNNSSRKQLTVYQQQQLLNKEQISSF
eukprot:403345482